MPEYKTPDERWQAYLTGTAPDLARLRKYYRLLPSSPRCKYCNAPFGGVGGLLMRVWAGRGPSSLNPRLCNI